MNKDDRSLGLTLGALRYQLLAHDAWGEETLSHLRRNLDCIAFVDPPDQVIHLLEFSPTQQEIAEIQSDYLPDRLANLLPGSPPRQDWKLTSDNTGHYSWCHVGASHALWTYCAKTSHYQAAFQLPWQPIFQDMVKRGGGILHGGVVSLENRGYLFTAPPGGGKTTALARIPLPWKVLSDDAALVWPVENGAFRASPLPTWGVLINRSTIISGIDRWNVGASFQVAGVVYLTKADREKISPLQPFAAAPRLYRALSEHPAIVSNRDPFQKQLIRTACELARAVPSWELELTRDGKFWDRLQEAFPSAR